MKYICIIISIYTLILQSLSPTFKIQTVSYTNETSTNSDLELETPSAILMEASTGTVLFDKNSHEKMRPASITKIMTLILIFEAIENKQIKLEDNVTISEHAAGMGGSQVYLETGEVQTVNDLIKCISICSANDACVAMAEFIDGTESAFVSHMNQKAAELKMNDTTFINCCGLEAEGHLTSAYDIALMSRELINKHPQIHDYCTIWMDTIIHKTKRGESEFGLTNTNKLLRQYSYTTGLKTGFTQLSKYCLSATAKRDNIHLIAVVMAEENIKIRNKEAISLLDYGFAHCQLYEDSLTEPLPNITVEKGTLSTVPICYQNSFRYIITDKTSPESIQKELHLPQSLTAPLKKGEAVGKVSFSIQGTEIGYVPIICQKDVTRANLWDYFSSNLTQYLLQ